MSDIEIDDRMRGIKAFYDICSKLMGNLENEKYGDLNYNAICRKFKSCPPCVELLQDAGFVRSEEGSRLKFDRLYLKNLSNVMQKLNDMI